MLWFRLSGVLWLRWAERAFLPLLFQLPPRSTRLSPLMARTRLIILHLGRLKTQQLLTPPSTGIAVRDDAVERRVA